MKLEAETRKIEATPRNEKFVADLDNLERLMKLAGMMAHITFQQIGNDGHLLIGPASDQVGEPDGDANVLQGPEDGREGNNPADPPL